MEVAKQDGRQARDRIVKVRCPVLSAGLVGDEFDKSEVADPGRAISVEIAGVATQVLLVPTCSVVGFNILLAPGS